ncbi:hypothetical protein TNCT_449151 [Trichonephila clavata]|uniref:Uncharacterized protein n=1 Tax=Trichonephila clavata TaxID=2740835 RepID=A0A8X6GHI9_TRICU|nr:hypothetical protein TNCT_449151 [Trichonephila clavata]
MIRRRPSLVPLRHSHPDVREQAMAFTIPIPFPRTDIGFAVKCDVRIVTDFLIFFYSFVFSYGEGHSSGGVRGTRSRDDHDAGQWHSAIRRRIHLTAFAMKISHQRSTYSVESLRLKGNV